MIIFTDIIFIIFEFKVLFTLIFFQILNYKTAFILIDINIYNYVKESAQFTVYIIRNFKIRIETIARIF